MPDDEKQIRNLIDTWHRASAFGDLSTVLSLMAEDAVFLTPGNPPMLGRDAFAATFSQMKEKFHLESTGDIKEVNITGDWAYCWAHLKVTVTPIDGGSPVRRSGSTLTIFRKNSDGSWVLFRDANMLAVEPGAS